MTRIHPQPADDPHCQHPTVYLADASRFDTAWDDYELMLGCVLCSQWMSAPCTWQTSTESFMIRAHSTGEPFYG